MDFHNEASGRGWWGWEGRGKSFSERITRPAAATRYDSWINKKQLPKQVDWRVRGLCDPSSRAQRGSRKFTDFGRRIASRVPWTLFILRPPFTSASASSSLPLSARSARPIRPSRSYDSLRECLRNFHILCKHRILSTHLLFLRFYLSAASLLTFTVSPRHAALPSDFLCAYFRAFLPPGCPPLSLTNSPGCDMGLYERVWWDRILFLPESRSLVSAVISESTCFRFV